MFVVEMAEFYLHPPHHCLQHHTDHCQTGSLSEITRRFSCYVSVWFFWYNLINMARKFQLIFLQQNLFSKLYESSFQFERHYSK